MFELLIKYLLLLTLATGVVACSKYSDESDESNESNDRNAAISADADKVQKKTRCFLD